MRSRQRAECGALSCLLSAGSNVYRRMDHAVIELAPDHKSGLMVDNPILLGGGVIGCGEALPQVVKDSGIGAAVVGPILQNSRRGPLPPRLSEGNGGFVLDTGLQNRGVYKTVKLFRKTWNRLGFPLIGQIADRERDALVAVVERLESSEALAGFELLIHPDAGEAEVRALVGGLKLTSELPLWVKLPFESGRRLSSAAADAGADALVVSQAPFGSLDRSMNSVVDDRLNQRVQHGFGAESERVSGSLYGPLVFPMMLNNLSQIADQRLGVPLIACGGIHSWDDASSAMSAGASAVQLDAAIWIEPGIAMEMVRAWSVGDES